MKKSILQILIFRAEPGEDADLKPRRSSAFSSLPSLCQVILGDGTAMKGTGMCSFSVSTTIRSRVWKSSVGLPVNTEVRWFEDSPTSAEET